jgi:hypothetical protein
MIHSFMCIHDGTIPSMLAEGSLRQGLQNSVEKQHAEAKFASEKSTETALLKTLHEKSDICKTREVRAGVSQMSSPRDTGSQCIENRISFT